MPAALPGESTNNVSGNPSVGLPIIYDLLSGPKGSPFDKDTGTYASTGALCTGIGVGPSVVVSPPIDTTGSGVANAILRAGFTQNVIPGVTPPAGSGTSAFLMYAGGGKMVSSTLLKGRPFIPSPYTAGYGIGAAGNSATRDGGAGPAFTGFKLQMLINSTPNLAPAGVVNGTMLNRTNQTLPQNSSLFALDSAATAAVS